MRNHSRTVLGIVLSLLATLWFLPAPAAEAASGYALTATGAGVTTTSTSRKLTVTYKHKGKAVKKATALLQYRMGSTWVTEKKVTVKNGKGATTVKHSVMDRTYRFYVKGKAASKSFVVHFVPANFTIKGSGSGHGVGMPQYGAYQLAREGRSAREILGYYYPGTKTGTANHNPRTVKVQVLGPPADTRTTTTLTVQGSGFTLTDAGGKTLGSYATAGKVAISVSGTKVTATVTLADGKVKNKKLASTTRLRLAWDNTKGTVTVAGAQGSYRYGNLQVTVLGKRPNVVNQLAMNTEYLYGIDEMPASWGTAGGQEALKAQVIAARNYVITQILRLPEAQRAESAGSPGCDCHVFDDTRSQNFTGWKKAGKTANRPWVDAVKATFRANPAQPDGGEVDILRDPALGIAETPFFASSGSSSGAGTAANAEVFGTTQLPYLVHVDDPHSAKAPGNPYLAWSSQLTQAKAKQIFGTAVKRLAVSARYPGGLVRSVTVTTASGTTKTLTKTADGWRTALGVPGPWVASISGK